MKTTFDPLAQRYPSQRFPVYAREGMVNCSSPQAAAAGLEALRRGGNAMDAAVAAASALTVVEPTANGIGSDAFALVWSEKDKKLFGLNSSGPAPRLASIEAVLADDGLDGAKVTVDGEVGDEILVRNVVINLSETVIAGESEHINKYAEVRKKVAAYLRVSEDKVSVYG